MLIKMDLLLFNGSLGELHGLEPVQVVGVEEESTPLLTLLQVEVVVLWELEPLRQLKIKQEEVLELELFLGLIVDH